MSNDKIVYIDVMYTATELAPPRPTVAEMLRECVNEIGPRQVAQELDLERANAPAHA